MCYFCVCVCACECKCVRRPEESTGSVEAAVSRQTWVLGLSLGPLEELYALLPISVLKLSVFCHLLCCVPKI